MKFMTPEFSKALGLTVIDAFWQGAILLLIVLVFISLFKQVSPRIKYRLIVTMMLAMPIWSLVSFNNHYKPVSINATNASYVPVSENFVSVTEIPTITLEETAQLSTLDMVVSWIQSNADLAANFWLIGIVVFGLRLLGGLAYLRILRKSANDILDEHWNKRIKELTNKLNIKRTVRLAESIKVNSPIVLGYLKPIILFPMGLIQGMPTDQIEAIITHEMAHIKRVDFLINLLLSTLKVIYFFHPAYWWLYSQAEQEREYHCDLLAIDMIGNKLSLIKALASIQELKLSGLVPAPGFAKGKNQLLERILRITEGRPRTNWLSGILSLLFIAMAFAMVSWKSVQNEQISKETKFEPLSKISQDTITINTVLISNHLMDKFWDDYELRDKKIRDEIGTLLYISKRFIRYYLGSALQTKSDYETSRSILKMIQKKQEELAIKSLNEKSKSLLQIIKELPATDSLGLINLNIQAAHSILDDIEENLKRENNKKSEKNQIKTDTITPITNKKVQTTLLLSNQKDADEIWKEMQSLFTQMQKIFEQGPRKANQKKIDEIKVELEELGNRITVLQKRSQENNSSSENTKRLKELERALAELNEGMLELEEGLEEGLAINALENKERETLERQLKQEKVSPIKSTTYSDELRVTEIEVNSSNEDPVYKEAILYFLENGWSDALLEVDGEIINKSVIEYVRSVDIKNLGRIEQLSGELANRLYRERKTGDRRVVKVLSKDYAHSLKGHNQTQQLIYLDKAWKQFIKADPKNLTSIDFDQYKTILNGEVIEKTTPSVLIEQYGKRYTAHIYVRKALAVVLYGNEFIGDDLGIYFPFIDGKNTSITEFYEKLLGLREEINKSPKKFSAEIVEEVKYQSKYKLEMSNTKPNLKLSKNDGSEARLEFKNYGRYGFTVADMENMGVVDLSELSKSMAETSAGEKGASQLTVIVKPLESKIEKFDIALEKSLMQDSLIDVGVVNSIFLETKRMLINSAVQPKRVLKQYLKLYEKTLGYSLDKNVSYHFKK